MNYPDACLLTACRISTTEFLFYFDPAFVCSLKNLKTSGMLPPMISP
jgi:hypothetical protein